MEGYLWKDTYLWKDILLNIHIWVDNFFISLPAFLSVLWACHPTVFWFSWFPLESAVNRIEPSLYMVSYFPFLYAKFYLCLSTQWLISLDVDLFTVLLSEVYITMSYQVPHHYFFTIESAFLYLLFLWDSLFMFVSVFDIPQFSRALMISLQFLLPAPLIELYLLIYFQIHWACLLQSLIILW